MSSAPSPLLQPIESEVKSLAEIHCLMQSFLKGWRWLFTFALLTCSLLEMWLMLIMPRLEWNYAQLLGSAVRLPTLSRWIFAARPEISWSLLLLMPITIVLIWRMPTPARVFAFSGAVGFVLALIFMSTFMGLVAPLLFIISGLS